MQNYLVWWCMNDVLNTTYELKVPAIFRFASDLSTLILTLHQYHVIWFQPSTILEIANKTILKLSATKRRGKIIKWVLKAWCYGTTISMFIVLYIIYIDTYAALVEKLEKLDKLFALVCFKIFHLFLSGIFCRLCILTRNLLGALYQFVPKSR